MSDEYVVKLQQDIELGDGAQKWLLSPVGRRVIAMVERERTQALEALACVDPTDSKTITELQNKYWRADQFQAWLAEIIEAAQEAEGSLDVRE